MYRLVGGWTWDVCGACCIKTHIRACLALISAVAGKPLSTTATPRSKSRVAAASALHPAAGSQAMIRSLGRAAPRSPIGGEEPPPTTISLCLMARKNKEWRACPCAGTQSLYKETASQRSHLDDVDRRSSVVVIVVPGMLKGKREVRTLAGSFDLVLSFCT